MMKYIITGGAGHTARPLAEGLLKAGKDVTVIGRNPEHLKGLANLGAKTAIGSVEDVEFLKKAFAGAGAVYTLIPTRPDSTDLKGDIARIGRNYAEAIAGSGITHVVNLSSIGAHMPKNCGPVSGLHFAEEAFNQLMGVNVLHLRPGYFFSNFFANIPMIKFMNIIGNNFHGSSKIVMSETNDIAEAALQELLDLKFKGHGIRYLASDEKSGLEIASILGTAIGRKDLPWVEFTDEQALIGMMQAGLAGELARNYTEMGTAMRSGKMFEDYLRNKPSRLGKTKFEDFAKVFASAYQAN